MSAEQKAISAGTSPDVLQLVKSSEFLVRCLKKAKFGPDMCQDTADACDINDLDAFVLGCGQLSVGEASEKLFLMQDEASATLQVCKKECLRAGVNFGDGSYLDPSELEEKEEEVEEVPAPPPPKPIAPPPPVATSAFSTAAKSLSTTPSLSSQYSSELPRVPSLTKAPSARSDRSISDSGMLPPTPDPENPGTSSLTPEHKTLKSTIPKGPSAPVTPTVLATPRDKAATRAAPSSSISKAQATPRQAPMTARTPPASNGQSQAGTATKTPRPQSAVPYKAAPTPTTNGSAHTPLTARGRPQSARPNSTFSSSTTTLPTPRSTVTPSYAKPTAAHKARHETDMPSTSGANGSSTSRTSAVMSRSAMLPARDTSPEQKERKKPVFAQISSSLLRPTKAFLAWTSAKKEKEETDLKSSQALKGTQSASKPFNLSASRKADGDRPLTTEERQLQEMQEKGFKARPMPRSRPASASVGGTPPAGSTGRPPSDSDAKATTPEPFRLASLDRHQKAQEDLARKIEEKAKAETTIPKFRASPAPSGGGARPVAAEQEVEAAAVEEV